MSYSPPIYTPPYYPPMRVPPGGYQPQPATGFPPTPPLGGGHQPGYPYPGSYPGPTYPGSYPPYPPGYPPRGISGGVPPRRHSDNHHRRKHSGRRRHRHRYNHLDSDESSEDELFSRNDARLLQEMKGKRNTGLFGQLNPFDVNKYTIDCDASIGQRARCARDFVEEVCSDMWVTYDQTFDFPFEYTSMADMVDRTNGQEFKQPTGMIRFQTPERTERSLAAVFVIDFPPQELKKHPDWWKQRNIMKHIELVLAERNCFVAIITDGNSYAIRDWESDEFDYIRQQYQTQYTDIKVKWRDTFRSKEKIRARQCNVQKRRMYGDFFRQFETELVQASTSKHKNRAGKLLEKVLKQGFKNKQHFEARYGLLEKRNEKLVIRPRAGGRHMPGRHPALVPKQRIVH